MSKIKLDFGFEKYKRADLINAFKTLGAYEVALQDKPFVLASGKQSDYYIDVRKLALDSFGSTLVAQSILATISYYFDTHNINHNDVDGMISIGGQGLGGTLLVNSVLSVAGCYENNLGFKVKGFVIRDEVKDHGLLNKVEGWSSVNNKNLGCFVLEDVVTTGNSVIQAINTVKAGGNKVEAVIVLVDRQEGGIENIRDAHPDIECLTVLRKKDLS